MQKIAYNKPLLTYQQQVDLLKARGLAVSNEPAALALLERVGYYRLSAYLYPFRDLLPSGQANYPHEYRASTFQSGSTFGDASSLYWFDVGLRKVLGDGLRELELHLRAQLAYQIGQLSPFGHDDPQVVNTSTSKRLRNYSRWDSSFTKSVRNASRTDFVAHFLAKYQQQIPPIWMLVETLDLGGTTSLYSVLSRPLQNSIGRKFGVSQGSVLEDWLQNLREVRNITAHHGRLWNARLNWRLSATASVFPQLAGAPAQPKIYLSAALLLCLLESAGIAGNFKAQFVTLISQFPTPANMAVTPENDMGFPVGWKTLPLWT